MRVLLVINRFSTAGAETSLRELVVRSPPSISYGLVVLHGDGNRSDPEVLERVEMFVPAEVLRWSGKVAHVRRAIERFQPELVHTTLFDADTAGRIAARLTGRPVLMSLVNTPYAPEAVRASDVARWKLSAVKGLDRLLSRHSTTHFHAITQAVADHYVQEFGLSSDRVTVVPRGRCRSRLGFPGLERRARVRAALGIGEEMPVLLSLGRQEPQKGHEDLLEALPRLIDVRPELVALIAGRSGSATSRLEGLRASLGLDARQVRFLGFRDDVGDLLAAADLFVFPSRYEGLGGSVIEAMAMELPIVATEVPALREVLDEGECGVLVPPGDVRALVRACERLLGDRPLARTLGRRARERFEATYTVEHMVDGMSQLYARLCS